MATVDTLYDSETNDKLTAEDLDCTDEQYAELIAESLASGTHEGHIRLLNGRRVYAN